MGVVTSSDSYLGVYYYYYLGKSLVEAFRRRATSLLFFMELIERCRNAEPGWTLGIS